MARGKKANGRTPLGDSAILARERARLLEPLEHLSPQEARFLLQNRTHPVVQAIIVAYNLVNDLPLVGEHRIGWNEQVRDWRASETYPFGDEKEMGK